MAHIRERKTLNGGTCYQANVRLQGKPHCSRTFAYRADAERWAKETEAALRMGKHDRNEMPRACGCYIIWFGKQCQYVGSSRANVMKRISDWCGGAATHYTVVPCAPNELLATEYCLIATHQPLANKLGKYPRNRDVGKYL